MFQDALGDERGAEAAQVLVVAEGAGDVTDVARVDPADTSVIQDLGQMRLQLRIIDLGISSVRPDERRIVRPQHERCFDAPPSACGNEAGKFGRAGFDDGGFSTHRFEPFGMVEIPVHAAGGVEERIRCGRNRCFPSIHC